MTRLLTTAALVLALSAPAYAASAAPVGAKIWVEKGTCLEGEKNICVEVHLEGDILQGDAARFAQIVRDAHAPMERTTVVLNSLGGRVYDGIMIAAIVHEAKWATFVDHDRVCASACAEIWLAGRIRYSSPSARIGFHTMYQNVGNKKLRDDKGNEELLPFYRKIGISDKAARIFAAADPDDMLWMDFGLASKLGIDVVEWPPKKPVTENAAK